MILELVVLDDHDVRRISRLSVRRYPLQDDPLSEYEGEHYLWPRCEKEKQVFEAFIKRHFYLRALEWRESKKGKPFLVLDSDMVWRFKYQWEQFPKFVIVDDLTDLTLAGALTRETPEARQRTDIGELVYQAKYRGSDSALDELCDSVSKMVAESRVYPHIDYVVPMPPSKPRSPNKVPQRVAAAIADALRAEYSTDILRASAPRSSLKGLPKEQKARVLQGTMEVDTGIRNSFATILLVDDNYQSGTSFNYATLALKGDNYSPLGVCGFACDKTLRSDDNVR